MSKDVLCFSQLRWDLVVQRPHHLMTRASRTHRVFWIEEPVRAAVDELRIRRQRNILILTPRLQNRPGRSADEGLRALLDPFLSEAGVTAPILWYLTPMFLPATRHLTASLVIYDCMDQLSGFDGAPSELPKLEAELLRRADLVFTGGRSLFLDKRERHASVHLFPSSVDVDHFSLARRRQADPIDQAQIGAPRLGYYGVIDERIDFPLLDEVAEGHPDWHIVLVGPIAKIKPSRIPKRPNIHRLGPKSYDDLPRYLAGWDVAIMPFAHNAATKFISPTKTPEYLAGGRPVASTSIADVVNPYQKLGLVDIGDTATGFARAITTALARDLEAHQAASDRFLASNSWESTWHAMSALVAAAIVERSERTERTERTADRTGPVLTATGVLPTGRAPLSNSKAPMPRRDRVALPVEAGVAGRRAS